jgi:pimeloyl-ACP methyl ester carboxylesterase
VVEERLRQITRDMALPPEQWVPGWLQGLFTQAAPREVVEEMRAIMSASHPDGARAMAHAFAEADLRDVLPRIQAPTLLLYGAADQRASREVAEDLQAKIPGSQLVMLPGVGHQSNLEAPERFTAEVRTFLRSV